MTSVYGEGWRNLGETDLDGAWGIAIVRSILDGVTPNPRSIASHLGVDTGAGVDKLRHPFTLLSLNGIFLHNRIHDDHKALSREPYDQLAWGYYAGVACGATGNVVRIERRPWQAKRT